jgi:hypothetical protein
MRPHGVTNQKCTIKIFHSRKNLQTEIIIQRYTQTILTINRNLFIPEIDLITNLPPDTN